MVLSHPLILLKDRDTLIQKKLQTTEVIPHSSAKYHTPRNICTAPYIIDLCSETSQASKANSFRPKISHDGPA